MADRNKDQSPAIRGSYIVAAMIFLLLASWIVSGQINELQAFMQPKPVTPPLVTGAAAPLPPPTRPDPSKPPPPNPSSAPNAATAPNAEQTPTVRVRTIVAE